MMWIRWKLAEGRTRPGVGRMRSERGDPGVYIRGIRGGWAASRVRYTPPTAEEKRRHPKG